MADNLKVVSEVEDLLAPISADHPVGVDITLTPEWLAINEARRKDKLTGRRNCDWPLIQRLIAEALAHSAKDLRLAVWLMEANVTLQGFCGLGGGASLLSGLIARYWDSGLYPEIENGDLQFRAMPLQWIGTDNFVDAIVQVPITARSDGGRNYSWRDYTLSRTIGRQQDTRNSFGDVDPDKESKRNTALASGGISGEMFDECVKATHRADLETVKADFEFAWDEFQKLDHLMLEHFGEQAPTTSSPRDALENCRRLLDDLLKTKRQEEPDAKMIQEDNGAVSDRTINNLTSFAYSEASVDGTWREAEELVTQGKLEKGLSQMTQIAAQNYGRARFQQRLRLAEICLTISRERLAVIILEDLARNIEEMNLEKWETPELLGCVWGRLYRCYKTAASGSEQAIRGATYFDRLCKLDPWQALRWDD